VGGLVDGCNEISLPEGSNVNENMTHRFGMWAWLMLVRQADPMTTGSLSANKHINPTVARDAHSVANGPEVNFYTYYTPVAHGDGLPISADSHPAFSKLLDMVYYLQYH